jgi:probable HAF family extracellular repeat protein
MNNAKRLIIVLLGSLIASQAVAWSGLTYSVKVIDVPGSTTTSVKSINDRGQVVGTYYDGSRHLSFIYRGGKFTTLDFPNSIETTAHAINDRGQVAGEYWNGGGDVKSFVYSNGTFETLNVPGYNVAYGINDRGQVTGYYEDSGTHEFIYSDDTFITFDIPDYSITSDINNRGQVVGRYSVGSHYYGFIYNDKGGVFKTVDIPGSTYTSAYSINAKGVVAGTYISYSDGNYIGHGFVYNRGKYITLDVVPGQCCTSAFSINDSGQVAGTYNVGFGEQFFVYNRGTFARFDFPGGNPGQSNSPLSINAKGQVAGRFCNGSRCYGFIASPIPSSKKDCEREDRKSDDFKNQRQCIRFVNTRDDHGDHGHE